MTRREEWRGHQPTTSKTMDPEAPQPFSCLIFLLFFPLRGPHPSPLVPRCPLYVSLDPVLSFSFSFFFPFAFFSLFFFSFFPRFSHIIATTARSGQRSGARQKLYQLSGNDPATATTAPRLSLASSVQIRIAGADSVQVALPFSSVSGISKRSSDRHHQSEIRRS